MYNGRLEDGSNVVIKCLRLKLKYSPQSLTQFIESISKLGNRHVVSILGHSVSDDCQRVFLVFEVVSNGNLRTHMTGEQNSLSLSPSLSTFSLDLIGRVLGQNGGRGRC